MKLRILGNSIRLRLTQSEVQTFAEDGHVEDRIQFGPDTAMVYALHASNAASQLTVRYEAGRITVVVPSDQVKRWADTDQVGLEATQPIDGTEVLSILVEKDFKCLHGPATRQDADAFPHPMAE